VVSVKNTSDGHPHSSNAQLEIDKFHGKWILLDCGESYQWVTAKSFRGVPEHRTTSEYKSKLTRHSTNNDDGM